MINYILFAGIVLACAALYAIKGGQHGPLKRAILRSMGVEYDSQNKIIGKLRWYVVPVERLLDGKILSAILFSALVNTLAHWQPYNPALSYLAGLGWPAWAVMIAMAVGAFAIWLAAVAPSMGEEAGGAGGYKGAWGEYIELLEADGSQYFGRWFAIQKGVTRGLWTGYALAVWFWATTLTAMAFLTFAATMPLAFFVGISFEQWRKNLIRPGWWLTEWIYGGIGIGVPLGIFFVVF